MAIENLQFRFATPFRYLKLQNIAVITQLFFSNNANIILYKRS